MPIAQNILFKCTNCIYREYRLIGDCRPDPKEFKPCPICGASMKIVKENKKGLLYKIFANIKKKLNN